MSPGGGSGSPRVRLPPTPALPSRQGWLEEGREGCHSGHGSARRAVLPQKAAHRRGRCELRRQGQSPQNNNLPARSPNPVTYLGAPSSAAHRSSPPPGHRQRTATLRLPSLTGLRTARPPPPSNRRARAPPLSTAPRRAAHAREGGNTPHTPTPHPNGRLRSKVNGRATVNGRGGARSAARVMKEGVKGRGGGTRVGKGPVGGDTPGRRARNGRPWEELKWKRLGAERLCVFFSPRGLVQTGSSSAFEEKFTPKLERDVRTSESCCRGICQPLITDRKINKRKR